MIVARVCREKCPGSNEEAVHNRAQKGAEETVVLDDAAVMTSKQDVLRFLTGRRISVRPLSAFSFTASSFFRRKRARVTNSSLLSVTCLQSNLVVIAKKCRKCAIY